MSKRCMCSTPLSQLAVRWRPEGARMLAVQGGEMSDCIHCVNLYWTRMERQRTRGNPAGADIDTI